MDRAEVTGPDPRFDGDDDWEPVFAQESSDIFLRCFAQDGGYHGDLRIARAETDAYAYTLVSAANAGMRFMQNAVIDRAVGKILDGHDGQAGE